MSVRVRKANGERVVPDEKVAEYLEMGYSVIDSKGNVIKRPDPKTVGEFKTIIAEKEKQHEEALAALNSENDRLAVIIAEKEKQISELFEKLEATSKPKKAGKASEST